MKTKYRLLSIVMVGLLTFTLLPVPVAWAFGPYDAAIENAVKWLENSQKPSGAFGDSQMVLETSEVLTLVPTGAFSKPDTVLRAQSWLTGQTAQNHDDLFRQLGVPALQTGRGVAEILSVQNEDGGFGLSTRYRSDGWDTLLALDALMRITLTEVAAASNGVSYLLATQNLDGGWSFAKDSKSSEYLTAHALVTLQKFKQTSRQPSDALDVALLNGRSFLLSKIRPDGTWGLDEFSVKTTLFACAAIKYTDEEVYDKALEALIAVVRLDGSLFASPSLTARLVWLLSLPEQPPVSPVKIIQDILITAPSNIIAYDDMSFLPLLDGFYETTMTISAYIETPNKSLIPLSKEMGRYPWNTAQSGPGAYNIIILIRDKATDECIDMARKPFIVEDSFAVSSLDITFTPEYYRLGVHSGVTIGLNVQTRSNRTQKMTASIAVLSEDKSQTLLQYSKEVLCGGTPDSASFSLVLFEPQVSQPTKYIVNAVLRAKNAEGSAAQRTLELFPPPPEMRVELGGTLSKNALMPGDDEIALALNVGSFGNIPAETPKKTYDTGEDFSTGSAINIAVDDDGSIALEDTTRPFHFIWVANSTKGTVMKINTDTCAVVGEYYTSPQGQPRNPSRTTVDHDGNVWVANRDGNSLTKIGLVENGGWVDKNGDGVCNTSTGLGDIKPWTNAGGTDTNGGTTTAADECILLYSKVSSSGTRHVSVDKDNNVWVSGTGNRVFNLLDGQTGKTLRTEGSVGYGGYGGLIDKNGVIWSSNFLLRWDTAKPLNGPNGTNWQGYGHDSYGLAIDSKGYVWNSSLNNGNIRKFAPDGTLVGTYPQGYSQSQGVAVGLDDDVWISHSLYKASIGRMKNDGTYVGTLNTIDGVIGVAVDAKGFIWITTGSASNKGYVQKIDPNQGPIGADGKTPIGQVVWTSQDFKGQLYNYSDMTGSTLTAPPKIGTWASIFDSEKSATEWGIISWSEEIQGDGNVEVYASSSVDGVTFSAPTRVENAKAFDLAPGRYLKTEVRLRRSSEGDSPVVSSVTVSAKSLSGTNVTLSATIPGTVIPVADTTLSPAPTRRTNHPDGSVTVQWDKANIFMAQDLAFNITYTGHDLVPDTLVPLARDITLTYLDSAEALIKTTLPPVTVKVNPYRVLGHITLDKSAYGARADVHIDISAQSFLVPPKTLTGTLEIADASGARLALLANDLTLMDTLAGSYTWNTGEVLSGTYCARLRLYDGATLACETQSSFTVSPEGGFRSGIFPEKNRYNRETVAVLHDTVENTFRNYFPGRVTDTITILDRAGNAHFTQTFDLGNLFAPSRDVTARWNIGRVLPGKYLAQAVVREDGVVVAQSECEIEITATGGYGFAGKLDIPRKTVTLGDGVTVNYDIENVGTSDADTAYALISVLKPDTLATVYSVRTLYRLPVGTKHVGAFSVPSGLLNIGDYIVIYNVEADGKLYPMQSSGFGVIARGGSGTPPPTDEVSLPDDETPLEGLTPYVIEGVDVDTHMIIYTAEDTWGLQETYHVFAPRLPGWILAEGQADFQVFTNKNFPETVRFYYKADMGGTHEQYMYGYPDLTIAPDRLITRAEAAALMYRLIRDPEKGSFAVSKHKFSDTKGHWAEKEIEYLGTVGLVSGYPDGTYRPSEPMTREELITVLVAYANRQPEVLVETGSGGWSGSSIDIAVSNGYINGFSDGQLHLKKKITRAQAVAILNRIWDRSFDKRYVSEQTLKYSDIGKTHWSYPHIVEATLTHEYRRDGGNEILVK